MSCIRDTALWRYEIDGRSERDGARPIVNMIEDAAGAPVGCVVHEGRLRWHDDGRHVRGHRGRVVAVEPWTPEQALADAAFPDLTFLKILFGYRTLAALRPAFPDCYARDAQAAALVDALFPKRPSLVWPVA